MIELPYSLIIEATEEPDFFGFYSPTLKVLLASVIRSRIVCIKLAGR